MKTALQKQTTAAPATTETPTRRLAAPEVNIFETKDGYVLQAEMPGVNKSGLDVLLEGNELTIHGLREVETPVGQPLHRESTGFDFRRVFELDPSIDAGKIQAQMEQGVLTLHLPKAERVKPRKIAVTD